MTPRSIPELGEKGTTKLVYDGLDLSGVTYKRGQFNASNRHEQKKTVKREAQVAARKAKKAEAAAAAKKAGGVAKAKTNASQPIRI